jgi:hypothetical protein
MTLELPPLDLPKIAGFVMSAGSAAVSGYVWVQQRAANRPCLTTTLAGIERIHCHIGGTDATLKFGLQLKFVVANLSTQPNAIVRVRYTLAGRSGWPTDGVIETGPKSPASELPINLPPRTTTPLTTLAWFELTKPPGYDPNADTGYRESLGQFAANPLVLMVELTGLGGQPFRCPVRL